MIPNVEIVETKLGRFLLFETDDLISKTLREKGIWGELESGIAIYMARHTGPSFILDIGANLGAFSIPVAKNLVQEDIWVHSFEPQRIVYQQLNGNLFLNQIENCITHNCALGSSSTRLDLPKINYLLTQNIGAVSLIEEIRQVDSKVSYHQEDFECIQVKTLDSYVDQFQGQCSFIKIDVEGYESEVISGGVNFLKKHLFPPVLFEEWRKGKFAGKVGVIVNHRQEKTRSLLSQLGYYFYNFGLETLAQHPKAKTQAVIKETSNGLRELVRIR